MPAIDPARLAQTASVAGLTLTAAQCERLVRYCELLFKWNRTHNLTAIDDTEQALTHHLLDSLSLVRWFEQPEHHAARVLDVGSGGGLPGIPLAIACPRLQVTLLDKVQKKVAFLTQAKVDLELSNVVAVAARVEHWRAPAPFDVIVSRAFASLADFVSLTRHLLAAEGRWLAMKGQRPVQEVTQLPSDITVVDILRLDVPGLNEARHLVELASVV